MKSRHISFVLALVVSLLLASCGSDVRVGELQNESQSVPLGDSESVSVEIEFGAGDLVLTGGAEQQLEADFTYNVASLKPAIEHSGDTVTIRQPDSEGMPDLRGITGFRNEWDLRLQNDVPTSLKVNMGAGDSDLDLAGLSLTGLNITLGAGHSTLDLSGDWKNDLAVAIETGAASIRVILPKDVGTRIEIDSGPTIINAPDLIKDGNVYTNAAYGRSETTMNISMETGIGVVNLETQTG